MTASDDGSGAPSETFFTSLDRDVQQVIVAASHRVAATNAGFDASTVTRNVATLHDLLDLLGGSRPLRLLTARDMAEDAERLLAPEARALTGRDEAEAANAAARVRDLITAEVGRVRAARRAEKRAPKEDAAARSARRERDRLNELTASRDRHKGRADRLSAENATLRQRIAQMEEDTDEIERLLAAARQQVTTLRTSRRRPAELAADLADELEGMLTSDGQHPAASPHGRSALEGLGHLTLLDPRVVGAEPIAGPTASDQGEQVTVPSHRQAFHATRNSGPESEPRTFLRHLHALLRVVANPPKGVSRLEGLAERALTVDVLGGGFEIGGSCVLVTAGASRILVDCGARPRGSDAETMRPPEYNRALDGPVDAVVITHAHNDHAGWVPALLAQRPDIPVFSTPATSDLLATMWFDSAKVLERNGVSAYTTEDVRAALGAIVETTYGHVVRVGDLALELFPAGHIVGAAGVVVTAGERRVVISGDVSAASQETVGGFTQPNSAQGADMLLLETTYAGDNRHHTPRARVVQEFISTVQRVADRDGVALVPAFALGRAQEVALLCARYAPDVPVLIDGLARAVTEVYERHPGPDGRIRDIFSSQVRRVPVGGTSEMSRTFRGGVVITTSGMLNQGPAVTWARHVLPDPNSALMIVGYQDEESPGGRLLRLAERGGGTFGLPANRGREPEEVSVNAEVDRYQLGAHANAEELAAIAQRMQARNLMPVHGEPASQQQFTMRMRQRSQRVVATGLWTP